MELKTTLTCPLGHKCEEARDGAIHRCAWFIKLRGTDPNTGKEVDEYGCAMAWMPVLMIENSQQQRGTSASIQSFRNEMVRANEMTCMALASVANDRLLAAQEGVINAV